MKKIALTLPLFLLLLGCQRQENQNGRVGQPSSTESPVRDSSHAPAIHTNAKPSPPKPVDELTKDERDAYKAQLHKRGYYDCCVKPSCNMCLYDEEECPCEDSVKKGEKVCGECYKGWQKGRGDVKDIDPAKVRRM